jgi:hypothetical protein
MPDLAYGPVAVVSNDFGDQRDSAGSVPFIHDFLELTAFEFACPFHYRALDVVGRHVERFGVCYGFPQSRVAFRVSAADPGRNRDFLDEFGKGSTALRVDGCLFVLDTVPLGMAGHKDTPYKCVYFGTQFSKK